MSEQTEPTEAELEATRERIRAFDHDSYDSCEAFAEAFIEAVPGEEVADLIAADPLLANLFCVVHQAAFEEGQTALLAELTGAMGAGQVIVGTIKMGRRPGNRRRQDEDNTTPSA